jgi:hypothetical protein
MPIYSNDSRINKNLMLIFTLRELLQMKSIEVNAIEINPVN